MVLRAGQWMIEDRIVKGNTPDGVFFSGGIISSSNCGDPAHLDEQSIASHRWAHDWLGRGGSRGLRLRHGRAEHQHGCLPAAHALGMNFERSAGSYPDNDTTNLVLPVGGGDVRYLPDS